MTVYVERCGTCPLFVPDGMENNEYCAHKEASRPNPRARQKVLTHDSNGRPFYYLEGPTITVVKTHGPNAMPTNCPMLGKQRVTVWRAPKEGE